MSALFVAGAHTDVGKTYVACALLQAARAKGLKTAAFKPVVSGIDPLDWTDSDPGRLLAALDLPLSPDNLQAVAPLRFAAALSPPMAARREGERLEVATIEAGCRAFLRQAAGDLVLVEGAGGVMSPLAEDALNLDLMRRLDLPVLLVGGSYLGSISHNLTALSVVRSAGLSVVALAVSQDGAPDAPDFKETVEDLRRFSEGTRVIAVPRHSIDWALELI